MQKKRDEESLTICKTELTNLLSEAVEHHNHVEASRAAVANAQQLALFHAWQEGIRLNNMKRLVGHGNWQKFRHHGSVVMLSNVAEWRAAGKLRL